MNELRQKVIIAAVNVAFVFVCLIVVVGVSFGWLASNSNVTATGMSLEVEDPLIYKFGETFTSNDGRHSEVTYTKSRNGVVDSNGDGLDFTGLLPGQTIDIKFSVSCSDKNNGNNFSLYFSSFDLGIPYSSASYPPEKNENSGWMKVGDYYHNVLGVYQYAIKSVDGVEVTNPTYNWLLTYNEEANDPIPTNINLYTGAWNKGNNYMEIVLSIRLDFTQFKAIGGTTNQLSERRLNIGSLCLGGASNA